MTRTPEDVIREALRSGAGGRLSEDPSHEALAALDALLAEREGLSDRLRDERSETDRLRRVEESAREVLTQMEGRRKASPMLAAIAALRAALKEGCEPPAEGV